MVRSLLRQTYNRYRNYSIAVNKIVALRLALWDEKQDIQVRPRDSSADVIMRGNSSDADVFNQIYIQKEYSCLLDMKEVDLVIDAGANVGYSSAYFLSHFTKCHVVAVEPDPSNFAALLANLAPFGSRATLLNCGLWSKPAQLAIETSLYRDGREWTRQVRECQPGERGEIQAITIDQILEESGRDRLSLLKMDIEGAEAVVFAAPTCQDWLGRTEAIAIELHDDTGFGRASDVFHNAISPQNFQVSHSGELTICRRF